MSPDPAHAPFAHAITRAAGFDAARLPEATAVVADARPWQWLVDPRTADEERAAYLARFVRGHGTVDPSDRDLARQARPASEVISGHLSGQVFLDLPGEPPVLLRLGHAAGSASEDGPTSAGAWAPGEVPAGEPPAGFPFSGPVAIVGTTVPAQHALAAVGVDVASGLADLLAGRGIESWPAMAVDLRREWLDPVLLVAAGDLSMVRTATEVFWQPFLTVWRPDPAHPDGLLEVVDADTGAVLATGAAELSVVGVRPCPLVPGAGCGDLCRMHGGPWVSRSITAASRWEARRARMIRALGCDACGDGAIKVFSRQVLGGGRQAIPIRPDTSTPTRYDRLVGVAEQGPAGPGPESMTREGM